MQFNNDIAWQYNAKRRAILKTMRYSDGKLITYERFLKNYLKSMSFMYQEVNADSKKYARIMDMCESIAKTQFDELPQHKEEL